MMKYSSIVSKSTVKKQVLAFLGQTCVNGLIAVSAMYDIQDRLRSARLFAEVMKEIYEGG